MKNEVWIVALGDDATEIWTGYHPDFGSDARVFFSYQFRGSSREFSIIVRVPEVSHPVATSDLRGAWMQPKRSTL